MIYRGIDISGWQKGLDFDRIPSNSGIDFCIIKIGENGVKSKYFDRFYDSCIEHNIKVGCYYYLSQGELGNTVGPDIVKWLDNRKLHYPIYLDVEEVDTELARNTRIAVQTGQYLEERKFYFGIYSSTFWMHKLLDENAVNRFDKWWAGWYKNTTLTSWPESRFEEKHRDKNLWQFGTYHLYPGMDVDGNLCRVNYLEIMVKNHLNGF